VGREDLTARGAEGPAEQTKQGRIWFADGSCIRLCAERPNHVWSYDFVEDRTHEGRKYRMLNLIDEFTHDRLAIRLNRKLKSADVIDVLSDQFILRGVPELLVAEQFSPLVTFEISPVFVTAGHPGHALDGRRARRITEVSPAGGREDAVIKLGELIMILDLHHQGLSVSAIARQMGVDRKTVRTYIAKGLEPPAYKKRPPAPSLVDRFEPYLCERLAAYPTLTARRLFREIKERGFSGGYSIVRDRVRDIRPAPSAGYEVRFETPPGQQAQVDFARFEVEFVDEPGLKRIVWLFSMVLGYSRLIWARFVLHQDLQSVLRCHIAALEAIGGAPRTILYDRMKTAVIGEDADGLVVYNRALVDLARHYGFQPRACRPYRAKTKGKVERPFRYIRGLLPRRRVPQSRRLE
jgi:transposase